MYEWRRSSARKGTACRPSSGRPFSAVSRQENLDRLANDTFDLLIIGGGITGVAIARDAAMRGLRTALVEKDDYGSGTSGRSSRLIHGGIRYLEYYQFRLVFEACRERRIMRRIAPRLVRPLPFLYPLYRDQKPAPWKLRLGLTLYDALGLFANIQRHRWLDPSEVSEREPLVSQRALLGAARFYDAQADDARLTLVTARSAHLHGAVMANHVRLVDLTRAYPHHLGACLIDELGDRQIEARSRVIVNATGVWSDEIRAMDDDRGKPMIRPSKGAHLVVKRERLGSNHAVVFDSPRDGRHVFLIPWGDFALIGTTDTDYAGDLDRPAASLEDVSYLLEAARHAFPASEIDEVDVISTFAGLRPLVVAPGGSYGVSRSHEIKHSPSGLLTIAGGKLTTQRLMAQQVVDRVQEKLGTAYGHRPGLACCTQQPLEGTQNGYPPAGVESNPVWESLADTYGRDAALIMELAQEDPVLAQRISPDGHHLMAEVPYAVQNEMAMTVSDVLARRIRVIHEERDGVLSRAHAVAQLMAPLLGWKDSEIDRQVSDYASEVALARGWRHGERSWPGPA
ncbi:MAG: glycerol-3-phosphate dehydrogenase/oxidase [Anaerolineae bacterium]|jgi:glycerol-3-phosphate dehydrogenase